jgi:hypothetical protein
VRSINAVTAGIGPDPHDVGAHTGQRIAQHARPRFQARRAGSIGAGQHQGRRAIIEARRIPRGDRSILLEGRTQPGQRLGGRCLGVFVGVELPRLAPVLHLDRRDLGGKPAFGDGPRRPGLACQRKRVLIGPVDAVFGGDVFGRDPHMPGAERAVERAQHHVAGAGIAHLLAPAGGRQDMGRAAHAFGTAGQRKMRIAQHQRLDRRDDRLGAPNRTAG